MVHIIVPIKQFSEAKTRLSNNFSPEMRQILARSMAENVLEELSGVAAVDNVIVATSMPMAFPLAEKYGYKVLLDEDSQRGLNGAVSNAIVYARDHGATDVGVVMTDLPFFDRDVFSRLLAGHLAGPERHATLVTDRLNDGTNIRLIRPTDLIPSHYGPDSFQKHYQAAINAGAIVSVVNSEPLRFDLDCSADLYSIIAWSAETTLPTNHPVELLKMWQPIWQTPGLEKCA